MKRRTLDILFSLGGAGLAGLLLVMAFVLNTNASFAETYVADQLSAQKITFKTADKLTPEEKAYTQQNTGCLIANAGKRLTTGKQAECYANEFIGLHLQGIAGGRTYSELGDVQVGLRAQIAAAQAANDPGVAALQKQMADTTAARETVFKGEMLRGALLTSYGFSDLGSKAGQAAQVAFGAAILLAILALAGFVHAFVTPKSRAFAPVESQVGKVELAGT